MTAKTHTYKTNSGTLVFGGKQLIPRLKSGYIGFITFNMQFTDSEMAQIQAKLPESLDKCSAEVEILKALDIKPAFERLAKPIPKAEINPALADKTSILTEKAQRFINGFNAKFPANSKTIKQPNADALKVVVDNDFKDNETDKLALYEHFGIKTEEFSF